MTNLHFNLQLVQFFVDHRNPILTRFFLTASFFGSATFYAFLTVLLYVVWDKRKAIRLSLLILIAMSLNDILKLSIKNLRPFVNDGSYLKKWAVSPIEAKGLAAEYSTPSGHAMGSSAFYGYFYSLVRSRFVRTLFVILIVLICVSRPYLGVHYVEDVSLGCVFGLCIAFVAVRFGDQLAQRWVACSYGGQIATAVAASIMLWSAAVAVNDGRIDGQVCELVANLGFLTGIVIAVPLELRIVNFDPRSGGYAAKAIRYAICAILTLVVLFTLKHAFRSFAVDTTPVGCALEYLRYVAADLAGLFIAPFIFCKLKLADPCADPQLP